MDELIYESSHYFIKKCHKTGYFYFTQNILAPTLKDIGYENKKFNNILINDFNGIKVEGYGEIYFENLEDIKNLINNWLEPKVLMYQLSKGD
ncbi:MAG: hypothetical protein ACOCP8_01970 [archaeon]